MTKSMNHTSHFCVTFNHDTGEFYLDEETALGSFGKGRGTIFDNEKQEWINQDDNTAISFDVDTFALEQLQELVRAWNNNYSFKIQAQNEFIYDVVRTGK